jgi:hypothetical protein
VVAIACSESLLVYITSTATEIAVCKLMYSYYTESFERTFAEVSIAFDHSAGDSRAYKDP